MYLKRMMHREQIEELMTRAQQNYLDGAPQAALDHDLIALKNAKEFGDTHLLARVHVEVARCYRWLHKPHFAMEHVHEGLNLCAEFSDPKFEAFARYIHGRILVQLGLSDEAYEEFNLVLEWAKDVNDIEMQVRVRDWMAIVFVLASNFDKAQSIFEEVFALQDQHNFFELRSILPLHRGFLHTRFADYCKEQGDMQAYRDNFEVAMMWTKQAIDAAFEIGDRWYQFVSLCNAAECAAVLGDFDDAHDFLDRVSELPDTLMQVGAVHFLYTKSEVANRNDDTDAAIKFARDALDVAKENPDADNIMNAQRRLAEAFENAQLYEEGLAAFKAYHALFKKSLARRAYWQDRVAQYHTNVQKIEHQLQQANSQVAEMTEAAYQDALTGLSNRRAFDKILRSLEDTSNRNYVMCILDIDHFKAVNDQFSHIVGDDVLKHVADIMNDMVRKDDLVSRVGGEEFAIFMPSITLQDAVTRCEDIRQKVQGWSWSDFAKGLKVSISAGVASGGECQSAYDVHALADARLFLAKENGRNRTEYRSAI